MKGPIVLGKGLEGAGAELKGGGLWPTDRAQGLSFGSYTSLSLELDDLGQNMSATRALVSPAGFPLKKALGPGPMQGVIFYR